MAKETRPFPRFLYSNPSNTKSEGPFIVHTIEPKGILVIDEINFSDPKIYFDESGKPVSQTIDVLNFKMKFIEVWDEYPDFIKEQICDRASLWLKRQILEKQIPSPWTSEIPIF